MQEVILTGLYIYPIKSLRGIAVNSTTVERRGLQYDRRWMLIDENNKFISQRECPKMATISVEISDRALVVNAEGMTAIIPFEPDTSDRIQVIIWKSLCEAVSYSDRINAWFTEVLARPCRLVYMPQETCRRVNPKYDVNDSIVSFADGYPFLLIGEASLADLNQRLDNPIPMNRFRPNLVVSGAPAFAEDEWKEIAIAQATFHVVKPCDRCSIPSIDQETGIPTGQKLLKTLASYRLANKTLFNKQVDSGSFDNTILFGQNLIGDREGACLKVGEAVKIVERH
jgi:uncharacterized protein YcbX